MNVNVAELILSNPLALALYLAHNAILNSDIVAQVPVKYMQFMIEYRNVYRSRTELMPFDMVDTFHPTSGEILWFSGGSDSVCMSRLFPDIPRVTATSFLPIKDFRFKQEFQLALATSILGAKVGYVGANLSDSDYGITDEIWDYENNLAFSKLWTAHFKSELRYPLIEAGLDKVDVYAKLRDTGGLQGLIHCKQDPPCWRCFDCVLHYFLMEGLGQPVIKPSEAAINGALAYAQSALEGSYDDPHFVHVLSKLHRLHGYPMWERLNALHS